MSDDLEIGYGDWVQLPELPGQPHLSRKLAEVIKVDGWIITVYVPRVGKRVVSASVLTKVRWQTHSYHHLNDPEPGDHGDDGPFCRCGEPVSVQGQACRWCRIQERIEEVAY